MKAAPVSEIKSTLQLLSVREVSELCLRLARFRKENKELLSYLLFEADDEAGYIRNVKSEMDELFKSVHRKSFYTGKNELRKILKFTNQQIKYSGHKRTEVELLIHFCKGMKNTGISLNNHPVLLNLYLRQKQRIRKALSILHEDLQFDYNDDLKEI